MSGARNRAFSDTIDGHGEVPERLNGAVSKTVDGFAIPGFESLPLRQKKPSAEYVIANKLGAQTHFDYIALEIFYSAERCPSGRRSTTGNRVLANPVEGSNPSLSAMVA